MDILDIIFIVMVVLACLYLLLISIRYDREIKSIRCKDKEIEYLRYENDRLSDELERSNREISRSSLAILNREDEIDELNREIRNLRNMLNQKWRDSKLKNLEGTNVD